MYRTEEFAEIAKGRSIAQMAVDVNSIRLGSRESSLGELENDIRMLEYVLETWKPTNGSPVNTLVDNALKLYIEAVLVAVKVEH